MARDVVVETCRAGGPGGQHRNVTDSAVRLWHVPSGVQVVANESRSQHRNRAVAFERLIEKLERLNKVPVRRVPTRRTRGAVERRLAEKKRRQTIKRRREPPRNEP
ncbi:MAG: peptide chain release factor-like protein [Nitrospira sp.]|nr:peptide chain release factor-like protein [Nitrospira sp.]